MSNATRILSTYAMVEGMGGVIEQAAKRVASGGLVAMPTETVYGLAADGTNDRAVASVYATKARPEFNPLIVHVCDAEMAARYVVVAEMAVKLAAAFWPGPLTLIMPRRADSAISLLASAGGDTLAVRVPAHPVAQALIHAVNRGLVAPSANRSGRISPTSAAHVLSEFPADIWILDGGDCAIGIESTVVDCTGEMPLILRPGSVTDTMIKVQTGLEATYHSSAVTQPHLSSPGMLTSHYAPDHPVRLDVREPEAEEGLLAFGPFVPKGAKYVRNLSEISDMNEAAANLFRMLRELDACDISAIAVMPVPSDGIGRAIADRLQRAAAARNGAD